MKLTLAAFVQDILRVAAEGRDIDGQWLQETAVKHGIMKRVKFGPSLLGPNDDGVETGGPFFVQTAEFGQALLEEDVDYGTPVKKGTLK